MGLRKLAIIPAFNEEMSIEKTVDEVIDYAPDYDYLVINDCSTDDTLEICRRRGYHVVNLPINLGIGGAVQTGYLYAWENGYDIAVQLDADAQHDPAFLKQMEQALLAEDCEMVIGSRFIEGEGFQSKGMRRLGIRWFSFLTKVLFGKQIMDPTSGMRMCGRKAMKLFVRDYPRDYPEPETVCRLLRHGFKVKEVPVIMRSRRKGKSSIAGIWNACYYMSKVTMAVLFEKIR